MSQMIKCEMCNGTGQQMRQGNAYAQCFSCNGNGRFHPPDHMCPRCGGMVAIGTTGARCVGMYCSWVNELQSSEPTWWHDGTKVYLDGKSWCATKADFINLQVSPAGFGRSPQEAVDNLALEVKAK
jgi:hypothetical protein